MPVSSLFSKFKGLGPVVVVGTAVLVTIKLLTTQTPQIEEIIQVKAEEDIKTEDYKDEIKEPEEPPAPPAEEEKVEEQEAEQKQEEEADSEKEESEEEDSSDSSDSEEEKEEEKEKSDEKEQPKSTPRTWKDTGNPLVDMLKNLISPKK